MFERLPSLPGPLQPRLDALVRLVQQRGLGVAAQGARWALDLEKRTEDWSEWEYRTLSRLMHVLCDYDGDLPRPSDTFGLEATLEFVETLPEGRRRQLRDLLALLAAGPLVLGPEAERSSFVELSDRAARTYLASLAESPLPPLRAAFRALKSICMMGYWSQPETWDSIGYSLDANPGLDTSTSSS